MAPPTTTTGFLQVSTSPPISIFYSLDGPLDGSKPIIALSNSLAATTHLWTSFVHEFSPQYTILRYDPRFHGQSPPSPDPSFSYAQGHSIADLTSDLLALLDHLNIPQLEALIGLSIGAAVALTLGATHPERAKHVFVVGTKAAGSPAADVAHDKRIAYGRAHGPLAAGKQSVERWFSAAYRAAHPEETAFVESIVGGQSIDGLEANIVALRKLDLWPSVEGIRTRGDGDRFVFVAGEEDGSVAVDSQELAEKAGARFVVVEGCGHIVNVQAPERFYEIIRQYIG